MAPKDALVKGTLSADEKFRIVIGALDMDDSLGSDFLRLSKAD